MSTTSTSNSLGESFRAVGPAWNRFWFTPADPISLGVIRILTGLLAIYLVATYSWDLPRFFDADGLVTTSLAHDLRMEQATTGAPRERMAFSYLNWFDSPTGLWAAHVAGLAILVSFTLGIGTRISSVAALIVVLSYFHRGPLLTAQLEPLLCAALFYLCLAPSGATLSFDRWLNWRNQVKAAHDAGAKSLPEPEPVAPSMAANVVLRLIQVHVSVIFLMMALGKLSGPTGAWWSGEAVWWLLARPETRPFDMTRFFASNTATEMLVDLWTHIIVWFELAFSVFIWNRWARPLMLLGAVFVWAPLVALASGLFAFPAILLVLALSFVPPEALRRKLSPVFSKHPAMA